MASGRSLRRGVEASPELAELRRMLAEAGAPDEVLQLVDRGGDPAEVMSRLVDAGLLPGREDALAGIIEGWTPLLAKGVDPLTAELAGLDFLAVVRGAEGDPDRVSAMLTTMLAEAESYGGGAALAFARAMAVVGPDDVRAAATATGDRLVAGGLKDRPWVKGLGAPRAGACFGYGDEFGAQQAVALTFSYGRHAHAVVVLIDHDLGGGVKDCWVADEPDLIRHQYQLASRNIGVRFRMYQPAQAREIVERALSRPPCPVQPDQVEDVATNLDLLRRRTALLTASVGSVYRLKVTLRGSKPPIWRRLEVPSGITLQKLHLVIQAAFGWQDYHLWAFDTDAGRYGQADRELGIQSAARKKLADVGTRFSYTYDFGDDWEHTVVVEDVVGAELGVAYPRCVTGRRAGPPEDCGGIWGYANLLEILADPNHEEYAERRSWADGFDPAGFDLSAINSALSGL